MSRILIIADDLSGAADCAGAFARSGWETLVLIDADKAQHAGDAAAAIAIDADTRRLPPAQAAAIHAALLERHWTPGRLLYRKIDSTLRGNFAQELAAIVGAAGLAIVAPAFPQAGRLTLQGRQHVHGVPLEDTEIWRNEGIAGIADIPAMLRREGIRAASIGIDAIRRGPDSLRSLLERHAADGVQAVVPDVEEEADLRIIARATLDLDMQRFWAGSAGLSAHLAALLPAGGMPPPPAAPCIAGAILTVVGSLSGVSARQAEHLVAHADVEHIAFPAAALREGRSHPQWQHGQRALADALASGRDTLVSIASEDIIAIDEGLQLCRSLAEALAPLASHLGAIVATGGETARALLTAMEITGLRLVGEIEPGVPLSVATGDRPIAVVTKAGAFGSHATLSACHRALQQARADRSARQPAAGS